MRSQPLKPILKWAGGKTKLLPAIKELLPEDFDDLAFNEPFFGGGSVGLALQPKQAIYSDANSELINFHRVVSSCPTSLIERYYRFKCTKEEFMRVRAWDREPDFATKYSFIERAARFLFLNKTCFNGLYRVNLNGHFNTSWGKKEQLPAIDTANIYAVSAYLKQDDIGILNVDFQSTFAAPGEFWYIDPPYLEEGVYNRYTKDEFGLKQHEELVDLCNQIENMGSRFMASNLDTPQVRELYKDFNLHEVNVNHIIGGKQTRRKFAKELLITNY